MKSAFDQVADAIAAEDAWVRVSSRQLNGPGTLAAVLSNLHPSPDTFDHVDVGVVLNRNNPESPIVWDCVGFPATDGQAWLEQSVVRWRHTAFAAAHDMKSHSVEGIQHLDAGDAAGLSDFHCVVVPGIAYGVGPFEELAAWARANPILPAIDGVVTERFFHPALNTVRVTFGGGEQSTIVDVHVNGEFDPQSADIVADMSWPRVEGSWIKAYAICVDQVT